MYDLSQLALYPLPVVESLLEVFLMEYLPSVLASHAILAPTPYALPARVPHALPELDGIGLII